MNGQYARPPTAPTSGPAGPAPHRLGGSGVAGTLGSGGPVPGRAAPGAWTGAAPPGAAAPTRPPQQQQQANNAPLNRPMNGSYATQQHHQQHQHQHQPHGQGQPQPQPQPQHNTNGGSPQVPQQPAGGQGPQPGQSYGNNVNNTNMNGTLSQGSGTQVGSSAPGPYRGQQPSGGPSGPAGPVPGRGGHPSSSLGPTTAQIKTEPTPAFLSNSAHITPNQRSPSEPPNGNFTPHARPGNGPPAQRPAPLPTRSHQPNQGGNGHTQVPVKTEQSTPSGPPPSIGRVEPGGDNAYRHQSKPRGTMSSIPDSEEPPSLFGVQQFSTEESEYLDKMLRQDLAPDKIAERKGPGNTTVHYIEGWRAIDEANQLFTVDGWSSKVVSMSVDYCEQTRDGKWSVSAAAIVRVTLKNGVFREDVGCGDHDNPRRATAIGHAKKEAVSDAIKRALKSFGPALGLSLYNKEYINSVKRKGPALAPGPGEDRPTMFEYVQRKRKRQRTDDPEDDVTSNSGTPPVSQTPSPDPQQQQTRPEFVQSAPSTW